MLAISTEIELMVIFSAIVFDAQPHLFKLPTTYNLPLAMCLDKDALLAETNASKQLAGTEQACEAVA